MITDFELNEDVFTTSNTPKFDFHLTTNRSIKIHYRNSILLKLLESIENKQSLPKITLLNCINILSEIWDTEITPIIIQNCFKKSGFYEVGWEEDSISLLHFQEAVRNFERLRLDASVEVEDSFEDYIEIDEVLVGDLLTNEDIIKSIRSSSIEVQNEINNENFDETEKNVIANEERPNEKYTSEVRDSVRTLLIALEQKENTSDSLFKNFNKKIK